MRITVDLKQGRITHESLSAMTFPSFIPYRTGWAVYTLSNVADISHMPSKDILTTAHTSSSPILFAPLQYVITV